MCSCEKNVEYIALRKVGSIKVFITSFMRCVNYILYVAIIDACVVYLMIYL